MGSRALSSLVLVLVFSACGGPPPRKPAALPKSPAPLPERPPPVFADAGVRDAGQPAEAAEVAGTSDDGASVEASEPAEPTASQIMAMSHEASTSLGAPGDGSLVGGVALPRSGPGFKHNPRRPDEARYATVELVQAIIAAAADVERELPGSGLVVNDLGHREGGPIVQHGSHQNGRDADILFYYLDRGGAPIPAVGVPLDPDGLGWDFKDLTTPVDDVRLRIDLPRTWRFMHGLVEHGGEHLQRIFIVEHVRSMLLSEARKGRAPAAIVHRFAQVSCQPGTPHDDHMHVRFYCSAEDIGSGCRDKPPIYPWRRRALSALGLEPVMAGPRSKAARAAVKKRTTTAAQARRRAGPMHWKVKRFLERRRAWLPKPSPGRPYCR